MRIFQLNTVQTEEWRDVPGYEGRYQVSDRGRIRGCRSGKLLKSQNQNSGYLSYHLSGGARGTRRIFLGHRLVAAAFFGPSDEHVNHKDGNKKNNVVSNLERTTRSENMQHAFATGLAEPPRRAVIGTPLGSGPAMRFDSQLAVELHFRSKATGVVARCIAGKCGSAYGYQWSRA